MAPRAVLLYPLQALPTVKLHRIAHCPAGLCVFSSAHISPIGSLALGGVSRVPADEYFLRFLIFEIRDPSRLTNASRPGRVPCVSFGFGFLVSTGSSARKSFLSEHRNELRTMSFHSQKENPGSSLSECAANQGISGEQVILLHNSHVCDSGIGSVVRASC